MSDCSGPDCDHSSHKKLAMPWLPHRLVEDTKTPRSLRKASRKEMVQGRLPKNRSKVR